jgi:hypothetical protein
MPLRKHMVGLKKFAGRDVRHVGSDERQYRIWAMYKLDIEGRATKSIIFAQYVKYRKPIAPRQTTTTSESNCGVYYVKYSVRVSSH